MSCLSGETEKLAQCPDFLVRWKTGPSVLSLWCHRKLGSLSHLSGVLENWAQYPVLSGETENWAQCPVFLVSQKAGLSVLYVWCDGKLSPLSSFW